MSSPLFLDHNRRSRWTCEHFAWIFGRTPRHPFGDRAFPAHAETRMPDCVRARRVASLSPKGALSGRCGEQFVKRIARMDGGLGGMAAVGIGSTETRSALRPAAGRDVPVETIPPATPHGVHRRSHRRRQGEHRGHGPDQSAEKATRSATRSGTDESKLFLPIQHVHQQKNHRARRPR